MSPVRAKGGIFSILFVPPGRPAIVLNIFGAQRRMREEVGSDSTSPQTQRMTMRMDPLEFRARTLRVHAFLHDVPLEDAWAIALPGGGPGRTIEDLLAVMASSRGDAPLIVKWLFWLRRRIGALLGWDEQRPAWDAESYMYRLSPSDRGQSRVAPGTRVGSFSLLYRFEDEQLAELRNRTVQAFSSLSIRRTPGGYLAYLGVFVKPVHGFTRLYMAAIKPFRRLLVYPSIIRKMQTEWAERFGAES